MTPVQVRWDIAYQSPGDGDKWWFQDRSSTDRVRVEGRLALLKLREPGGLVVRLARIEILEDSKGK